MESDLTPISLQESFCFSCSPDLPCFNECCRDLNQFLTPYDILRLKNHLGLPSGNFLRQYTSAHIGPESGLPIVTLKPRDPHKLICPFVTDAGCRVYENRPSSCRTYPLMRAVARSRSTGEMTAQYALLRESHCLGFEQGRARTPRQWTDDQGLAVYNENNDKLMRIISLKNRRIAGALDHESGRRFHTALYDLDNFRWQIQNTDLLANLGVSSRIMDAALRDDVALLDLAIQWVERDLLNPEQSKRKAETL